MLTLINTNRMQPPIAPVGLEYVACAARAAGLDVEVLDLGLVEDPGKTLQDYFAGHQPRLVGLSFRNLDDSFWPSAQWFAPDLAGTVRTLRGLTAAPLVLGGIGFSLFANRLVGYTGADFGIRGDGEGAIVSLYRELAGPTRFDRVPGLVCTGPGRTLANPPSWPESPTVPPVRDLVDHATYLKRGGQIGFETKRGCDRRCIYCADPLAKGAALRVRPAEEVADEIESLADQGIDVFHTCDAEFNIPRQHAVAVCEEMVRRGLARRVRWYAYLSVVPFDEDLARWMRRAGCVGINFTTDAACPEMLAVYSQPYAREAIVQAIRLCRGHGMAVMTDMLLGGPGETPQTLAQTIAFMRQVGPDGVGTSLGVRIYPDTEMERIVRSQGPLEANPGIRRRYDGPVDLFRPTFYVSPLLGPNPARLVKDLIAGDPRFFEPMEEAPAGQAGHADSKDHNYNENTELTGAIAAGARGAYWHILLRLRGLA
ncbi:MAG: radical SAM protein [Phycisphaerae bacterium]|nr:radical SAM protein [Phycisphaerae bacterium]